jgi:hypothetical protein
LLVDSFIPASGVHVHLYAQQSLPDISSARNTILLIRDGDVDINVTAVRE